MAKLSEAEVGDTVLIECRVEAKRETGLIELGMPGLYFGAVDGEFEVHSILPSFQEGDRVYNETYSKYNYSGKPPTGTIKLISGKKAWIDWDSGRSSILKTSSMKKVLNA
jgi:hypothetical protein